MSTENTTRGWHYYLTIYGPDDRLAVEINLTDEQAAQIYSCVKRDPRDDDDPPLGEYPVRKVFIGAVSDG